MNSDIPIVRPKDFKPKKLLEVMAVAIEPKEDGRWLRITNVGGRLRAHGHRVSTVTNELIEVKGPLDLWIPELTNSTFPDNTAIDGELYLPGRPASKVITALKNYPHELKYVAFSAPMIDGKDLTKKPYMLGRLAFRGKFPLTKLIDNGWIQPPRSYGNALGIAELYYPSYEGIVLKERWYSGWWKVKSTKTIDAIVENIKEGKGKYAGVAGSLELVLLDKFGNPHIIANVSGMDDETRFAITDNDIGRVLEVKYDCIAAQGKLRFPRFVRWRDDKNANDCTFDKQMGQVKAKQVFDRRIPDNDG